MKRKDSKVYAANLKLMAAAPDLLEAAKLIHKNMDREEFTAALIVLRLAIKKAETP